MFPHLKPDFVAFSFSSPCDAETAWFVRDVVKPQDELVLGVIAHNRRAQLAKLLEIRVKAVSLFAERVSAVASRGSLSGITTYPL